MRSGVFETRGVDWLVDSGGGNASAGSDVAGGRFSSHGLCHSSKYESGGGGGINGQKVHLRNLCGGEDEGPAELRH